MSPLGTLTGFSTQCCRHKPLTAHKVFRFHTSSEYRPVPPPAESERLSICLPPKKTETLVALTDGKVLKFLLHEINIAASQFHTNTVKYTVY